MKKKVIFVFDLPEPPVRACKPLPIFWDWQPFIRVALLTLTLMLNLESVEA